MSGPRTVDTGTGSIGYSANGISTRKYTWASFLPVSLLFQFRSISNSYFLLTAIIMMIPGVSPVSPLSALIPLVFVLFVSEVREFVEEYQKYKRDVETNRNTVKKVILKGGQTTLSTTTWESIYPGDMVVLFDRDKVPADIMVVFTPSNNFSYVETSNLDGETNLKTREAPQVFDNLVVVNSSLPQDQSGGLDPSPDDFDFTNLYGHCLAFEGPNPDMYRFKGTLNGSSNVSINNMMLRGCSMRNTQWAVGVVVYAGHDSKAMLNSASSGVMPSKKTQVERRMNIIVMIVFCCQLILVAGAAGGYSNEQNSSATANSNFWYLDGINTVSGGFAAMTFFILLSTIIPVSLWVSLEATMPSWNGLTPWSRW